MEFLDLGPAMLSWYLALALFLLLWVRDVFRLRERAHWRGYLLGVFRDYLLRRRLAVASAIALVGGIAQIVVDVVSSKPLGLGLLLLTGVTLLHVAAETRDFFAAEQQPQKKEVT